jgi:signal transduction histidine kinase
VKFTPNDGKITLTVCGNAAAETVSFAVSDTGIGIAAFDLSNLFQPFTQLHHGLGGSWLQGRTTTRRKPMWS